MPRPRKRNPVGKPPKETIAAPALRSAVNSLAESVPLLTESAQARMAEEGMLQAQILDFYRETGKDSLWFFLTEILFPDIWREHYTEAFHRPICDALQTLPPHHDLWLFLPRKHRKSYLASIAHTLWLIIKDPNIRILLVGARKETTNPFARLIRSAFRPGNAAFAKFQEIYSDFVFDSHQSSLAFIHPLRKKALADPTFRATYLGVSGAGWRCDVFKFTDPIERRNVTDTIQSNKALRNMLDLMPLRDDGGRYNILTGEGTRWAYHDPYGRILGEEEGLDTSLTDNVKRLRDNPSVHVHIRHALELPVPCTVCPPHIVAKFPHGAPSLSEDAVPVCSPIHTRESILREFDRYLVDPDEGEAMFWHQWMNVCKSPSTQRFRPEWFLRVPQPTWAAPRRRVICLDDASKDLQVAGSGDYSVAFFGEFSDEGRLLVVHGLRSSAWTKDEFIRRMLAYCQTSGWWPQLIVKEKVGTDSFLTDCKVQFATLYRPVEIIPVTRGTTGKHDLIVGALQGPLERGGLIFGCNFPMDIFERLKYETCNLGASRFDDCPDALALFFHEKVRSQASPRLAQRGTAWHKPGLGSYGVPATASPEVPAIVAVSPLDQALENLNFIEPKTTPGVAPNSKTPGVAWRRFVGGPT